jgi:hypothetical protein
MLFFFVACSMMGTILRENETKASREGLPHSNK